MGHVIKVFHTYWHSPLALVFFILLIPFVLFSIGVPVNAAGATISALLMGGATAGWYFLRRAPRASKDKVGFIVAIVAEDENHQKRIKADLITELRQTLSESAHSETFQFIELPAWHAQNITDNDSARKYLRKCRARLLIFGNARIRRVDGKDSHAFRLQQVVLHPSPIPTSLSRHIGAEVSEVSPADVRFALDNELNGFDVTSKWLTYAAQYFLALAALASRDFHVARSLLEELKASKGLAKLRGVPGVSKLKSLLPRRLADAHLGLAIEAYYQWCETRDVAVLNSMHTHLDELNRITPNIYQYHLLRAIWLFVVKRQPAAALDQCLRARSNADATWRYSAAFLNAYQGNLDAAEALYKKAADRHAAEHVANEVEEFMTWVLSEEPAKYQLYFCMALVNMFAKGDERSAERDFREFISRAEAAGEYGNAVMSARRHLDSLQKQSRTSDADEGEPAVAR